MSSADAARIHDTPTTGVSNNVKDRKFNGTPKYL